MTSVHPGLCALQEQDDAAEHAGPLAEIEFWRSRTVDLGGIRDQLDDKSLLPLMHAAASMPVQVLLLFILPVHSRVCKQWHG